MAGGCTVARQSEGVAGLGERAGRGLASAYPGGWRMSMAVAVSVWRGLR